jgi:hypothetical protein
LAESAYWILKKQEVYRDPQPKVKVPVKAGAANSMVGARKNVEPAVAPAGQSAARATRVPALGGEMQPAAGGKRCS